MEETKKSFQFEKKDIKDVKFEGGFQPAVKYDKSIVETPREIVKGALAEFTAMIFFVFFSVGSVTSMNLSNGIGGDAVPYSLTFGLSITVLAYAIGDISGGHINPAVTLSMALTRNISPVRCGAYFLGQFSGAIFGGGLLRLTQEPNSTLYHSGIGLNAHISEGGGLLYEFMGTLLLLFTIFQVATWSEIMHHRKNQVEMNKFSVMSVMAPLPIGFSVVVAHLALGPATGCGINPARVLGAVVWSADGFESYHWIYFVGPFVASCVAPLICWGFYGRVRPGGIPEAIEGTDQTSITVRDETVPSVDGLSA